MRDLALHHGGQRIEGQRVRRQRQWPGRHDVGDLDIAGAALGDDAIAEVGVGDDTDDPGVGLHHGDARDAPVAHDAGGGVGRVGWCHRDGVLGHHVTRGQHHEIEAGGGGAVFAGRSWVAAERAQADALDPDRLEIALELRVDVGDLHEGVARDLEDGAVLQGDGAIGGAAAAQQRANAERLPGTDAAEDLAGGRADLDFAGMDDVQVRVFLPQLQHRGAGSKCVLFDGSGKPHDGLCGQQSKGMARAQEGLDVVLRQRHRLPRVA